MACENNLERQGEEQQPRQWTDKRYLSPQQEWDEEVISEVTLSDSLEPKGKRRGKHFQTCKFCNFKINVLVFLVLVP